MSILWRSCLAFSVVIAIVQGGLALLSVLQHNAILSDLIRQRISVVAQTTATAFQPIVDLGLPLSMMRNGNEIAARALRTDPEIRAVHVFNPSGIIVYSTVAERPRSVPREVLRAMQLADDPAWSIETPDELDSGYSIRDRAGNLVGGVVVSYPKDRFASAAEAMAVRTAEAAFLLWAVFSALAYLVLRLYLAAPMRAVARLERLVRGQAQPSEKEPGRGGVFAREFENLEENLAAANAQFDQARNGLPAVDPSVRLPASAPREEIVPQVPGRSLAGRMARRLAPIAALLIIGAALILGALTVRDVHRSIEPELAARTSLIGTVVSENVTRAVAAGVPLDALVGAEAYFGDMLARLPEVAYIAVATGRIVLEAGERIDPYLAPPRERKDVRSHPILHQGEEIAYVIIDIDPAFIADRFRDVFLDLGVVVLVTLLLAFEVMVLLASRSLTAPLDRLQHLAALQALGDFSKRVAVGTTNQVDRLTARLVERAEQLNARLAPQSSNRALTTLRFPYFTDIRLALFLFVAADELPLSFLPLYTRAADNPWGWLDEAIVLSLPLAGYLLAILLATPWLGTLTRGLGQRRLLIVAAIPTLAAHVGLHLATSVPEIVLWRTITGFGYALITLACQDYVLAVVPRDQRNRSLGMFSMVLFSGIFCGAALGGVLADRLGQANVFLVSAALILFSTLLIARLLSPVSREEAPVAAPAGILALLSPLRNRRFAALIFGIVIPGGVMMQAFVAYLVALTLDALGASTADIGRLLMLHFIAAALAGPLAGRVAGERVPVPLIALAGGVLTGVTLLAVALWPGQLAMTIALLGSGLGRGLIRGAQVSLALHLAETELDTMGETSVLGALRTLERAGSIVGLLLIAALAGVVDYAGAIAVVAFWVLGGTLLFALVSVVSRSPASA